MKIKEIRVNRYGPLVNFVLENPGPLTLIHGRNESGKTLLLDAVLRFALSGVRDRNLFSGLDRVEHDPDGYLDILHQEQVLRLPADGTLPELLDLHAEDLRHVLVVRASDLQAPEGAEAEYYASLTDRLMGIHREALLSIRKELQELGRLTNPTSSAILSNTQEDDKLRDRWAAAADLRDQIAELLAGGEEDPADLERALVEQSAARRKAEDRLDVLKEARKREEYRTGRKALEELKAVRRELADLPEVTRGEVETWRDQTRALARAADERQEQKEILADLRTELEEIKEKHQENQRRLEEHRRKAGVVDELKNQADAQARRRRVRRALQGFRPLLIWGLAGLAVLFGTALTGMILRPGEALLEILTVVLGAAAGLDLVGLLTVLIQQGRTASGWEDLRLQAAAHGYQAEDFPDLLQALERVQSELEDLEKTAEGTRSVRDKTEARLEGRQERLEELEGQINRAGKAVHELETATGLRDLEGARQALGRRNDLEDQQRQLVTRLEERYDQGELPLEERTDAWAKSVAALEDFQEAAPGVEHDPEREEQLAGQIQDLTGEIQALEEDLRGFRKQAGGLAAEANRILNPPETLPGETIEDLNVLRDRLEEFLDRVEERKETALTALRLFERIEAAEEEKVRDLFGESDLASRFFREITGGAYQAVEYDPAAGELHVIRPSGKTLRADQLSTGTFDQLYFATRLSLAHQLFGGEPGFLLLDDPFLASDRVRLANQLEMLVELSRKGWQILYFSVKDEVAQGLGKLNGEVPGGITGIRLDQLAP